jgi:hypothetical protein
MKGIWPNTRSCKLSNSVLNGLRFSAPRGSTAFGSSLPGWLISALSPYSGPAKAKV